MQQLQVDVRTLKGSVMPSEMLVTGVVLLGVVVVLIGLAWFIFAASGSGTGTKSGEVPWETTPQDVIEQMVDLAELKPGDKVYDLGNKIQHVCAESAGSASSAGSDSAAIFFTRSHTAGCGDGRFCIAASKRGAEAVGYEVHVPDYVPGNNPRLPNPRRMRSRSSRPGLSGEA